MREQATVFEAAREVKVNGWAWITPTALFTQSMLDAATAEGEAFLADVRRTGKKYGLAGKRWLYSSRWWDRKTDALHAMSPYAQQALRAVYGDRLRLKIAEHWILFGPMGEPWKNSQNWHRDNDGDRVMKVFLNIHPVTEDSGPMEYLTGSHNGGDTDLCAPRAYLNPTKDVPELRVARFTSEAGKVLMVDTGGIHRGGRINKGHRLQAVWTFTPFTS